jgi:prepilin-type N-terminal cleavage/methylation domain-containing protein
MFLNRKNKKAFTLIETLVSLMMISIALLGIYSAIAKYTQQTKQMKENYTASLLGQEGIEIVRNMRDTNWVSRAAFANGLTGGTACSGDTGGWQADHTATGSANLVAYAGAYLNTDSDGFYTYSAGTVTPYKRQICIVQDTNTDILHVSVIVRWTSHTTTIREDLYNWKW